MIGIEISNNEEKYPNNVRFVAIYITGEENYKTFEDNESLEIWLKENREDIEIGNIVNLVIFEVSGVREISK